MKNPQKATNLSLLDSAFRTLFARHFTQAHLLTTLKKKSNGAIDCGNWTLNLGKPTKSNSFVTAVVRL